MTYQEVGDLSIRFIKKYHAELHDYFEEYATWYADPRDGELVDAIRDMRMILEARFGRIPFSDMDYKKAEEVLELGPEPVPKAFEEAFKEGELTL